MPAAAALPLAVLALASVREASALGLRPEAEMGPDEPLAASAGDPSVVVWDKNRTAEMNNAVANARKNVTPPIVPNVNDHLWYHGDYQFDKSNPLEAITMTSDAVGMSPQEIADYKAREAAAEAALGPKYEIAAIESQEYWKNYTRDAGNPLENFTLSSPHYYLNGTLKGNSNVNTLPDARSPLPSEPTPRGD